MPLPSSVHILQRPVTDVIWIGLGAGGGIACCAAAVKYYLRKAMGSANSGMPSSIDGIASGTSLFHRWDPRFKVSVILIYAFMIASLKSLEAAAGAMAISFLATLLARIPLFETLRRITALTGFLGMFLLVMPLSAPLKPGDTAIVFGGFSGLPFNLRGLTLAGTIVCKAVAIALLTAPMAATAPLSATVQGLNHLGISPQVGQMILLAHRYIFVFFKEAQRMLTSMKVRGFQQKTSARTLKTMAHFLGMLFVRSFERTHRVHEAMQSRGFQGTFPNYHRFKAIPLDWCLAGFWLCVGAVMLGVDRFLLT